MDNEVIEFFGKTDAVQQPLQRFFQKMIDQAAVRMHVFHKEGMSFLPKGMSPFILCG